MLDEDQNVVLCSSNVDAPYRLKNCSVVLMKNAEKLKKVGTIVLKSKKYSSADSIPSGAKLTSSPLLIYFKGIDSFTNPSFYESLSLLVLLTRTIQGK